MLRRAGLRRGFVAVVVLVAAVGGLAGGVWLLDDGPADRNEGATPVDGCTTISDPGNYELTTNVTASEADTCIRIQSDDVVFDGAGHRVEGVGAFGTAGLVVRASDDNSLANVTVRNVQVDRWDDGIRMIGIDNATAVGTTTARNRVGLSLLDVRDSRVANNTARQNRLRGISLLDTGANTTLANNTATDNALFGIHLVGDEVRNTTVVDNTASRNEFGVVLIGVRDTVVANNTADGNRIAGIWLSAAAATRIVNNSVSNRFYGIYLADRANGNVIADNVAVENEVGIRLRSSHDNRIVNNTVRANTDNGILLIASDDNVLTGNTGGGNARGITILRSTGNVRSNNSVAR